jgi:uncharacterized protein
MSPEPSHERQQIRAAHHSRPPRRAVGTAIVFLLALLGLGQTGCRSEAPENVDAQAHAREVEEWRQSRHQRLLEPDGWLTLVGLTWLQPGVSTLGSDPACDVVLPEGAPERLGSMALDEGGVSFQPYPGVAVQHDGEPVTAGSLPLATDREGEPSLLSWGSLRLEIIERRGRHAARVRDVESPLLESFHGLEYFPIDAEWRVTARFEPYDPPRMISVPDVFGDVDVEPSPGAVVFQRGGREARLDALPAAGGRLFLIFGDATNGGSTYGGGRYLYTDPPREGHVVVDFNQAYSPPCIFTPYATCPLPPRQNRFPFPVEAGEKTWRPQHEGAHGSP